MVKLGIVSDFRRKVTKMETKDDILVELHHEFTMEYLPLIICMACLGVIGIFGNIFTIAFYGFKTKRKSSTIVLVTYVAIFDLIVSFLMFDAVADLSVNVYFSSVALCKMVVFVNQSFIFVSVITLWIVSIDRYLKVCRPRSRQFSERSAKRCSLVIFICAIGLASKHLVTADIVHYDFERRNITAVAHDCLFSSAEGQEKSAFASNMLDIFLIFFVLLTFIYTYGNILVEIRKHKRDSRAPSGKAMQAAEGSDIGSDPRFTNSNIDESYDELKSSSVSRELSDGTSVENTSSAATGTSDCGRPLKSGGHEKDNTLMKVNMKDRERTLTPMSVNETEFSQDSREEMASVNPDDIEINSQNTIGNAKSVTFNTENMDKQSQAAGRKRIHSKRRAVPSRSITLMLTVVSIGLCCCFLPLLTWNISLVVHPAFRSLTPAIGAQIVSRLPFLNSIINPITFFIFHPQYRRYVQWNLQRCMRRIRMQS